MIPEMHQLTAGIIWQLCLWCHAAQKHHSTHSTLRLPQQTRTRDFTCSISEFTSSTGSIHVNSPDSVNKFDVSIRVSREITSFFTWWHVPVNPYQFWPSTTRVKLVTTGRTRVFTWIHVKNTYWWSGTNYEPVWHLPTGSEMVPCLLERYYLLIKIQTTCIMLFL